MSRPVQQAGFLERIAEWVNALPRATRIILNMGISLLVMGLLGVPIVLITAGSDVNTVESGEVLYVPTVVIAVVWLLLYGFGWGALVGFDWDDEETWQAGTSASLMIILGSVAFVLMMFACLYGFLFALVL